MKKILILLLMFLFTVPALSCSKEESRAASEAPAENTGDATLTVLNYGEYIDRSALDDFYDETGIRILYEEATTPEEMYAKYMGGAINYDLICTSDYMAQKLISEGELLKVDFDSFRYFENIDPKYLELSTSFDPGNQYCLPYFWGTIGILYDSSRIRDEIDSWEVLFNGEYSGEIIMQNSIRDAFMCALKYLGYSLNTTDRDELYEAWKLLMNQKKDVEAYFVDEVQSEMVAKNAELAVIYSGEAYLANEWDPDLAYVVPKEGTNVWVDVWCMTRRCKKPKNAEKFLDFLCREDIAMRNFEEIYYPTPNRAVFEALDEETKNDEFIFPDETALENSEIYIPLDPETTELMGQMWKELKVANP